MSASADDQAFVFDDWMAGYGVEPSLERLGDDAGERLFLVDCTHSAHSQ
ncbi:hypothetical protein [Paraburkholderia fungorum]